MRLSGFRATVKNVHSLGRFLTTVGFGTGETAVSSHDPSETALSPAEFRGALFLDSLNGMKRVLASRGAVALDLTGSLYHGNT